MRRRLAFVIAVAGLLGGMAAFKASVGPQGLPGKPPGLPDHQAREGAPAPTAEEEAGLPPVHIVPPVVPARPARPAQMRRDTPQAKAQRRTPGAARPDRSDGVGGPARKAPAVPRGRQGGLRQAPSARKQDPSLAASRAGQPRSNAGTRSAVADAISRAAGRLLAREPSEGVSPAAVPPVATVEPAASEGSPAPAGPNPPAGGATDARPAPHAPVLSPPVLLAVPGGAPPDAVRVILDRELLTPRLRVAAAGGTVVLAILVRADGTVAQIQVRVASGHEGLDAAAVSAARRWRFRPATRDGVPIEAWAVIPVRFTVP